MGGLLVQPLAWLGGLYVKWTSGRSAPRILQQARIDPPGAQDGVLVSRARGLLEPRARSPLDSPFAVGPGRGPHRLSVDEAEVRKRRGGLSRSGRAGRHRRTLGEI